MNTEGEKTLEEIAAAVTRYYDSLTNDERADDQAWGEFAATSSRQILLTNRDRSDVMLGGRKPPARYKRRM